MKLLRVQERDTGNLIEGEATLKDVQAWLGERGMVAVNRGNVSALLDDLEGPCDAKDCPQCQMYGELREAIGGDDGQAVERQA